MENIEIIEAAVGGPFRLRYDGAEHILPDPAGMHFQHVLTCLQNGTAPSLPRPMAQWKQLLAGQSWAAHYDLPDFASAQRLTYLLDRYRSAVVYDTQAFAGVDVGVLWRSRRWRTALDIIDHLPSHSWFSASVSGDTEHAAMIAESLAARQAEGEQTDTGPAMHTWTPEVAELRALRDDVRQLSYVIPASQGDKKVKPPEPLARPVSPLEAAIKSAKFNARKERHDALTKRLLPHKR